MAGTSNETWNFFLGLEAEGCYYYRGGESCDLLYSLLSRVHTFLSLHRHHTVDKRKGLWL